MYQLRSFANLKNGEKLENEALIIQKEINSGVTAVFVNAKGESAFDSEEAICVHIDIGENVQQLVSIYRKYFFWSVPEFVSDVKNVPDETQGLIYKKSNGEYGVIVPVVGKNYKTVLKGTGEGLCSRTFSWYDKLRSCNELLFVYAEGNNPYSLLSRCFEEAAKLLGGTCRLREERVYPEVFEYLGWCSWDSMQIRVNEDGLLEKCKEFKEKNIPIKWVLIDDMWAEIRDFYDVEYNSFEEMMNLMHGSALYSYEADPKRFPKGLKHTIKKINEYGIKVGMWYPTTGYWSGIEKDGTAYYNLKDYLVLNDDGYCIPNYTADKSYMYYKTVYDFFRRCGAEFIKTDNQSMITQFYKGIAPIGELASNYHSGLEAAVGEVFAGKMINCMGMSSEDMWNRSMSPISRCSADFMPEDRAWFRQHILQCTYNSLIQGQLYYSDYDMWWTDDEQALKNSVLRAVSGGPIYVSDKIDRSNKELLTPLAFNDGKILRCDRPGMPTKDCLTVDPETSGNVFKVQNIVGSSGVLAVFNLNKDETTAVTGTISPQDVEGLIDCEYAIYEHFSKKLNILRYTESMKITLRDADDFRLYILVPLKDGFGAIGRTDKFISPASIKCVFGKNILLKECGPYAYVDNRELVLVD